eukprot:13380265-Heterocapsa_arctica.AAC.1
MGVLGISCHRRRRHLRGTLRRCAGRWHSCRGCCRGFNPSAVSGRNEAERRRGAGSRGLSPSPHVARN